MCAQKSPVSPNAVLHNPKGPKAHSTEVTASSHQFSKALLSKASSTLPRDHSRPACEAAPEDDPGPELLAALHSP